MSPDESANGRLIPVPEDELLSAAHELVWHGFYMQEEVIERLEDYWLGSSQYSPPTEEQIELAVQQVWASRSVEIASGDGQDSYVRLQAAFDQLEASGIIARMNYSCCQRCGRAEIGGEDGAEVARGFVFFHEQDTEHIPGGDVMLAFGAFNGPKRNDIQLPSSALLPSLDPGLLAEVDAATDEDSRSLAGVRIQDAASLAVGREVAGVLRDHGLAVDWGGSAGERIGVGVPDWRKPLID